MNKFKYKDSIETLFHIAHKNVRRMGLKSVRKNVVLIISSLFQAPFLCVLSDNIKVVCFLRQSMFYGRCRQASVQPQDYWFAKGNFQNLNFCRLNAKISPHIIAFTSPSCLGEIGNCGQLNRVEIDRIIACNQPIHR